MVKFITTLAESELKTSGEKLFYSWEKYSNNKLLLYVYLNKEVEIPKEFLNLKNVKFKKINDENYYNFIEKYKDIPEYRGKLPNIPYEYRFDVVRFCHKIYVINEGLEILDKEKDELYIWWDADAYLTNKISSQILKTNLGPINWLAASLGRKDWDHTETGFIAFNLKHPEVENFIKDMVNLYNTGNIFKLNNGRTDSFVYDIVADYYKRNKNCLFKNISENIEGNDVWPKTFLSNFSVHLKGFEAKIKNNAISNEYINQISNNSKQTNVENKQTSVPVPMQQNLGFMERYKQLSKLIESFKFKIITEIGVSKGDRAEEMIRAVMKNSDRCIYFGFDLFEEITDEISKEEFNGKPKVYYDDVYKRLRNLQKEFPGLFFALYKGNTRETLKEYFDELNELSNNDGIIIHAKPSMTEFAFIDGGHSIETIRNDYEYFKNCKLVVLDDYYDVDENGVCPDISKVGCNFLLKEYPHMKVLPIKDRVITGGTVQFVLGGELAEKIIIKTENVNQVNNQPSQVIKTDNIKTGDGKSIQIQTRNSLPNEEIQRQVDITCQMMKKYNIPEIKKCEIHETWAYMVAGAPTYKKLKYMKMLEEAYNDRSKGLIFTSKTAHDYLIDNGIIPWACLLLDPRPHVIKTFKPHKDVLYLVASQCHPSVLERLLAEKVNIQIYHAAVAAGEDKIVKKHFPDGEIIPGGSTSQTRGISVLMKMGFYKFKLFGLDSSYPSKPDKVHGINQEKQAMEIEITNKETGKSYGKFWTDPEMIAQINDLEHIIKIFSHLKIECYSEGIFGNLFKDWYKNKEDFFNNYKIF